jgi:hypothetical protein
LSGRELFVRQLKLVHSFVVREELGAATRGFTCGILFGGDFVIIHSSRLKDIISRSKSSLNGLMQDLGFAGLQNAANFGEILGRLLPGVDQDLFEVKQWGIRRLIARDSTFAVGFPSHLPEPMVESFRRTMRSSFLKSIPLPRDEGLQILDLTLLLNRPPEERESEELELMNPARGERDVPARDWREWDGDDIKSEMLKLRIRPEIAEKLIGAGWDIGAILPDLTSAELERLGFSAPELAKFRVLIRKHNISSGEFRIGGAGE